MAKQHCSSMHNRDRISYLPDPIRIHIISFLPFTDAIRTKILSRRWNDMCTSLSNLDFWEIKDRKDLRDIIDQTLILHDGSDIHRFNLRLEPHAEDISPCLLNTWICFAFRHNVSELIIHDVRKEDLKMFPFPLFNSNTLTMLELNSCNLKLPSKVHFPVLKTLDLSYLTFSDEFVTSQLFSDSTRPILETSTIAQSHLDGSTLLFITSRSLKFLNIRDDNENHSLILNVSCPNIHEFLYQGNILPELTPATLSSLLVATFDLSSPVSNLSDTKNRARKILNGLVNVQKLNLEGCYIKVLAMLEDLSTCLPTPYSCLKDLVLCMDLSPKSQLQTITFLLRSYSNLQTLYMCFFEVDEDILSVEEYLQFKAFSTGYVLKNLRTVVFGEFQGSETEVSLVGYLLENANILNKLNIHWLDPKPEKVESRMCTDEKLLEFARLSPHAKIFMS